jgi:hypothetical protein
MFLSPENLKNNRVYGNKLCEKSVDHTRFLGHNINGLKLDLEGGNFTELCRVIKEIQADVVGISEHNIDSTQHYVQQLCYNALQQNLPRSKLTLGTTSISTTEHIYKPGGTLTISSGNIVSRVIETGSDEFVRWTFQTFAGCNDRTLALINAYQVCDKSQTQRGRSTAASQQESLLRQRGASDPDSRKHFRTDLMEFLQHLKTSKHHILLIRDFNKALGEDENGMCKLCSEIGLINLMAQMHGSSGPATYSQGKKRLDYALGSTKVSEALCRCCGYEPFHQRMFSDHQAYHLEFGSDTPELPPIAFRDIESKSPSSKSRFT